MPPLFKVIPARFYFSKFHSPTPVRTKVQMDKGYSWDVIIKFNHGLYLIIDGWKKVVNEANLKNDQILIFELINGKNLLMSIFGDNGLEIKLPDMPTFDEHNEVETVDVEEVKEDSLEEEFAVETPLPEKQFVVQRRPLVSKFLVFFYID